jgi:tetratricopeptide (TPR) repeat protein
MLKPGTVLDEKYEIVCTLGAGAFGCVYKAIQRQFDRPVAIKTLATTLLHEPDGAMRFEREAQAINALKHRNIVALYGYGSWQQAPYIVMELVEGSSLQQVITSAGKLEPKRAATIIKQVFEALACSHAAGVIHRDLKPSNIMLIPGGEGPELVKIIDFGLARLMPGYGIPGQKLTETGYALGTCHYMPPEQALGQPVEQQADIYSVGCILYQMLSGNLPFDGDNNVAVMFQHLNMTAPALETVLPDHPMLPALSSFVSNCMAKELSDRYQSSEDALADLNRILEGKFHSVKTLAAPIQRSKFAFLLNKKLALISVGVAATLAVGASIAAYQHVQRANHELEREVTERDTTELLRQAQTAVANGDHEDAIALLTSVLKLNEKQRLLNELREYEMTLDLISSLRYAGLKESGRTLWDNGQDAWSQQKARGLGVDSYIDKALRLRRFDTSHRRDTALINLLRFYERKPESIALAHEYMDRALANKQRFDEVTDGDHQVIAASDALLHFDMLDDCIRRTEAEINKTSTPMNSGVEAHLRTNLLQAKRTQLIERCTVPKPNGKKELDAEKFEAELRSESYQREAKRAYDLVMSTPTPINMDSLQHLVDLLVDFRQADLALTLADSLVPHYEKLTDSARDREYAERGLSLTRYKKFNIYVQHGRKAEALKLLAVLLPDPFLQQYQKETIYIFEGNESLRRNEFKTAEAAFQKVIAMHTKDEPTYTPLMGLARAQFGQQNYAGALTTLKRAGAPYPKPPFPCMLLQVACTAKLEGPAAASALANRYTYTRYGAVPFLQFDSQNARRVLEEAGGKDIYDRYATVLRQPLLSPLSI